MGTINPQLLGTSSAPIPEVQAWKSLYDGSAGPLVDLAQAVPGYPPPQALLDRLGGAAGSAAAATYGQVEGDMLLRETYAAHVASLHGAELSGTDVVITAGCNQAFFLAALAVAARGEAILMPRPCYFNYEMACDMLGIEARPLPCHAENGFVPDAGAAEALIDGRVRAIVLISPNNPTGAVYPPETIRSFAALCRRRGIWLILDETYRDFRGAEPGPAHDLFADPEWGDTLIALYSFSKAYCIPGHRMGALLAGPALVQQIGKAMDTLQICPPRPPQAPLAWAIGALAEWRAANALEIEARARAFRRALSAAPAFTIESMGAYFAYLRHPFPDEGARRVAERLVREAGILCLPGSYFGSGQEGHLRLAFANADSEALNSLGPRLAAFAGSPSV